MIGLQAAKRGFSWLCTLALLCAPVGAGAASFAVQVNKNNLALGGSVFQRRDVVLYDSDADTATLLLSRDAWSQNTRLDAFQLLSDGSMLVSHRHNSTRTLGGLALQDGDVAIYDPVSDVATMLIAETAFNQNTEVDAAHRLPNGNVLLSVAQNQRTLGGITFRDGDVIEYDPLADTAAVVFSEDLFEGKAGDVDGVQEGSIVFSVRENGITLAGVTFSQDDVVRFDPNLGTATVVVSSAEVPANTSLFGVFTPLIPVPEPPQALLLALGIAGLLLFPRFSRLRRARAGGR